MKIYDIVKETPVDEAPVGAFKRAGQAIGGMFSKATAAKGESSKEANQVFDDLKVYAARGNLDLKNFPVEKFKTFMQQKGYDTNLDQMIGKWTDPNDPESTLNRKQIEKIVLAQTRTAAIDNAKVTKGKFARNNQQQSSKTAKPSTKNSNKDLKQMAQTIKQLSDKEKQQLLKLL